MMSKSSISVSLSSSGSVNCWFICLSLKAWLNSFPVSRKMLFVFSRLNGFRQSANASRRMPLTAKPLVKRRSSRFSHGMLEEFSSSSTVPPRPARVGGPVCPFALFCSRVNDRPEATRNVANTPKSPKIDPTVVPCSKSAGNSSDSVPAKLCGRLCSSGRITSGGMTGSPVTIERFVFRRNSRSM